MAQVFQYLKCLKHSPESYEEQMHRASGIHRLTMMQKAFKALNMNRTYEINYKEFVVKRYRGLLRNILTKWYVVRTFTSRKLNSKEKAVLFYEQKLLKNTYDSLFYNWEDTVNTRTKQRFFNYWIRVHKKAEKDIENFATGCRKRHLTNFYFKMFKKTTKILINKKRIPGILLTRAFNNFRLAVSVGKYCRMMKNKVAKFRNKYHDTKLVTII
jgi:hypothetical protein